MPSRAGACGAQESLGVQVSELALSGALIGAAATNSRASAATVYPAELKGSSTPNFTRSDPGTPIAWLTMRWPNPPDAHRKPR
jgi:hypothetical protein